MPEENVEVVRSMLGAFNRDDVDAVIAAFDEGSEIGEPLEMPDSPAVGYRGHDASCRGLWCARPLMVALSDAPL